MNDYDNDPPQGRMPQHLRDMPVETQVAVLYERVGNGNQRITALGTEIDNLRKELGGQVQGLRRALWSFVFSLVGGAILFLFSIASGWVGPHSP